MTERKKIKLGTFARTVLNLQGSSGAGFRRNDADLDDYDSPPPALLGAMSNTNKFLRAASLRVIPVESEFASTNGDLGSAPSHSLQDKLQPVEEVSVRDDSSALQGRLDEISVLELMKDGGRNDLQLTVRGLHKHVLWCITQPLTVKEVSALRDDGGGAVVPGKAVTSTATTSDSDSSSNTGKEPVTATTGLKDRGFSEPKYGSFGPVASGSAMQSKAAVPTVNVPTEAVPPGDVPTKAVPPGDVPTETSSTDRQVSVTATDAPDVIPASIALPLELKEEKDTRIFELQSAMEKENIPQLNSSFHNAKNEVLPNRPISARERLGGYLHPRDMRRLISPFSASNEPELIVRRHAMLLNYDPLRAIILRDRLLVIVPKGAESLSRALEERLRGGVTTVVNAALEESANFEKTDNVGSNAAPKKKSGVVQSILNAAFDMKLASKSVGIDDSIHRKSSDAGSTAASTVLYDDGGEWDDIQNTTNVNLPFELLCVDTVLHMVTRILMDDTYRLQSSSFECIQNEGIGRRISDDGGGKMKAYRRRVSIDPLITIRLLKDAASEMGSRVDRFVQSMTRILDRDEDMALMNLSRLITHPDRFIRPVDAAVLNEELDEPQLMLEAHLQVGLTLENALNLLQGQLSTSTDLLGQKLTATSNRILFANMVISVFSLCVATGSFVGSIFGMNVTNFYEHSDHAFKIITFSTMGGSFLLGAVIMFLLIRSGTVPTTGLEDF